MPAYPEELKVEHDSNGVVVATFNRPDVLNAFNGALRIGIKELVTEVKQDSSVRALVLTGAGKAFCSGADLRAEDSRPWPRGPADPEFSWCVELLEMPKPTIVAVNGVAAGGGLGGSKRGIHPDDLITWTLPRLAGYSRALKWLYSGDDIPLQEAEGAGLIEPIVSENELMDKTLEFADKLAAGPTIQFALTKQAVLKSLTREPWDSAALESWGQDKARETMDFKEGIKAFKERRQPEFKGK